jgi:hypothetical protein
MMASWYGASKYSISRRYWWESIQFNAYEFGEEFSEEFGEEFDGEFRNSIRNSMRNSTVNTAVLGIISQLNATTPCPIGAIPDVLSPW